MNSVQIEQVGLKCEKPKDLMVLASTMPAFCISLAAWFPAPFKMKNGIGATKNRYISLQHLKVTEATTRDAA
jgi:hypothetical protein